MHYEGDTEVEELFDLEDDDPVVLEEEEKNICASKKEAEAASKEGTNNKVTFQCFRRSAT